MECKTKFFEETLVILKPDALSRKLVGEIISRIEKVGFNIHDIKMVWPTKEQIESHYSHLMSEVGLIDKIKKYFSNFVIVMIIGGNNSIKKMRAITGSTEPVCAEIGTIRGDFGSDSFESAKADWCYGGESRALRNIIHSSDSKEAFEKEVKIWFPEIL